MDGVYRPDLPPDVDVTFMHLGWDGPILLVRKSRVSLRFPSRQATSRTPHEHNAAKSKDAHNALRSARRP
jgi:hypothetical protein